MAIGGIAGLHAENMRGFKEGGILGFAEGKKVPDKKESSTPIGRWWDETVKGLSAADEEALLRNKVATMYGPKSALPGMFMDQTDEQRAASKEVMSKLRDMPIEEVRRLASGAVPSATSAPPAAPVTNFPPFQSPGPAAVPAPPTAMPPPGAMPPPAAGARPPPGARPPSGAMPGAGVGITSGMPQVQSKPLSIAEAYNQAKGVMGEDVESKNALNEYKRLLAEQPLAGQGAIDAATKAQLARDAANKKMDETAGQRQFMAFIESMRPQSLGALQNYKAGEDKRQFGIISEREANENLIAAQRDLQAAQRVGNAKEILGAQMKLQEANQKAVDARGHLAGEGMQSAASNVNAETAAKAHVTGAEIAGQAHIAGAEMQLRAARERVQQDHSMQEVAKIEERAQKNVKMMLDSDPTSGAKVIKDPGLVNRLVAQEIERVSNELQARRSGKPVSSTTPPPAAGAGGIPTGYEVVEKNK